MYIKKIICFIFLLVLLISCGNEPPSISFPMYNILVYQGGSLNNIPNDSVFLSFYFQMFDENGIEDIEKVKITHVNSEYSWTINRDLLTSYDWNEKTYYGFSFLEYNNAKQVLLGNYHAEVNDTAGNVSDLYFQVDGDVSSDETSGSTNKNKDMSGDNSVYLFNYPDIKYVITNDKNEIKISGDSYNSCEIKLLNNPEFYNFQRKKFVYPQKVVIDNKGKDLKDAFISIRINKDINENIVYFLRTYSITF